jgi:hypothetical protein
MTSNIQPALTELNKAMSSYGEDSVTSATAKPRMALELIKAASSGLINQDYAKTSYDMWKAGRNKAARRDSRLLAGVVRDNPKSDAANTSKNGRIIGWGATNTKAYDIAEHVIDMRQAMSDAGDEVKDTFQCLYDIAVQHNKNPGKVFTDEELAGHIRRKASEEKTELRKLQDEYARIYKLAMGTEDNPGGITVMQPVLQSMEQALIEYGGEEAIPAVTKEDKKAAEAIKFLREAGRLAA